MPGIVYCRNATCRLLNVNMNSLALDESITSDRIKIDRPYLQIQLETHRIPSITLSLEIVILYFRA